MMAESSPLPSIPTTHTNGGISHPATSDKNSSSSKSISPKNTSPDSNSKKSSTQTEVSKKKVYRYDRATMYALAPRFTQRPPDLPLILCRDEPGNLTEIKQEMEAKLVARRLSKSLHKDDELEVSDTKELDTSGPQELRADEIILGPPRKPFPSSSVPTPSVSTTSPLPDLDDPLSQCGTISDRIMPPKSKGKNRKHEDTINPRSPRKLPSANGKIPTAKQPPAIANPKPKVEQQEAQQLKASSSESARPNQVPALSDTPVSDSSTPNILEKLLGVHNPAQVNQQEPQTPMPAPPSTTPILPAAAEHPSAHDAIPVPPTSSFFINSSTSSHIDVDVDSFFAPGNDDATLHHLFHRKRYNVHSNDLPHNGLLKDNHFSALITPTSNISVPDPDSFVNNFLNNPIENMSLNESDIANEHETENETAGGFLFSRGFGRWFSSFESEAPPTETAASVLLRASSPVPSPFSYSSLPLSLSASSPLQQASATTTDPYPNQAADVYHLPHLQQQVPPLPHYPYHTSNSAATVQAVANNNSNNDGNTPIDVLLRNAFQAYEERIAAPSSINVINSNPSILSSSPATPAVVTAAIPPSINDIINGTHPTQVFTPVPTHATPEALLNATATSLVAAESLLLPPMPSSSPSVVDHQPSPTTTPTLPQVEQEAAPSSPPPGANGIAPASTTTATPTTTTGLSIPIAPPSIAPSPVGGRTHHPRSQQPNNNRANNKREPNSNHNNNKPGGKRTPLAYNNGSSSANMNSHNHNHNHSTRKKKDGHKVTGLLAPPTQPPPQAFLLNFNPLPTPHHHGHHPHGHHPHHHPFAMAPQPLQPFFAVPQPLPHHPPHVHTPSPPPSHAPVTITPPTTTATTPAMGLEKWFGSTIMAHTAAHDTLPSMPKARMMSVQEIESQMANNNNHNHNGHHGNNNHNHNHNHRNHNK